MIFLTNSGTDKLQLVTSAAADVDVLASWIDCVTTTGATSGVGRTGTAITTATTTDIVATPAASTSRNVTQFTIRNKDSADTTDVTVVFDANGTDYELHKVTLAPNEMLEYIEGVGFFTVAEEALFNETRYVTADSVHATAATFAGITGLSFNVVSGRNYAFEACLMHVENANTTGAQFAIGGVAMTGMSLVSMQAQTAAASTTSAIIQTGVATAVDTAVIVATAGQTTVLPTYLGGWFKPSANGTMLVKATSEVSVASGLTVKQGSWARVCETTN
jgi:hypothetical protein